MVTDLFEKKSKKRQLLEHIRERGEVRTSDVQMWGSRNFCNRAMRNARQLCQMGNIRRLTSSEKFIKYPKTREDVYSFVKD